MALVWLGTTFERTCREVDEPSFASGASLNEAGLSKLPTDLIYLLVRLDARSLTDFGIREAARLGSHQRQYPFTICHGLTSIIPHRTFPGVIAVWPNVTMQHWSVSSWLHASVRPWNLRRDEVGVRSHLLPHWLSETPSVSSRHVDSRDRAGPSRFGVAMTAVMIALCFAVSCSRSLLQSWPHPSAHIP